MVRRHLPQTPLAGRGLHPRNRLAGRYDFPALVRSSPALAPFVRRSPVGTDTIDFADPTAVTALNRALLKFHYGIAAWEIPPGYLCPPIPGRADYLHHLADLISADPHAGVPHGPKIAILDIGVGANCIYPIIGVCEYGWRFVGSEFDRAALVSARKIVAANPALAGGIELRPQPAATAIFCGVVRPGETFAASICNPPFHDSPAAAAAGTARKTKNLHGRAAHPVLNFGGSNHELWCAGGEVGFIRRMICESAELPDLCGWFTTLVSKRESLPAIDRALKAARAAEVRTIDFSHGQKKSRIVAWNFSGAGRRG